MIFGAKVKTKFIKDNTYLLGFCLDFRCSDVTVEYSIDGESRQ